MKLLTKIWLAGLVTTAMSISAFGACSTTLDMGSNKITNVGTPTSATDAATKAYADGAFKFATKDSEWGTVANGTNCSTKGDGWRYALSGECVLALSENGGTVPSNMTSVTSGYLNWVDSVYTYCYPRGHGEQRQKHIYPSNQWDIFRTVSDDDTACVKP